MNKSNFQAKHPERLCIMWRLFNVYFLYRSTDKDDDERKEKKDRKEDRKKSKPKRKEEDSDGEGEWETVKGGVAIPSVSIFCLKCLY